MKKENEKKGIDKSCKEAQVVAPQAKLAKKKSEYEPSDQFAFY